MSENRQRIDKFHLKGNASFTIREGWLTKGLRNVRNDPEVFLREDATVRLGIGSAMVKSLRFWLQAAGLTTEPKAGRRVQAVTDLGNLIMEKDTYFEDPFTLFLVHSHIATNPHLTTVWYLLFNYFTAQRFTREMMEESLLATFRELTSEEFALSSFKDDCAVALKTYVDDQSRQATPEDNMLCPLASLGLFSKTARDTYETTMPSPALLHPYAVMYVLLAAHGHKEGISIDRLLSEPCNAGRVLHLNAYRLNQYLDQLQAAGMLSIQRTAGLNMIYPTPGLTAIDVAQQYYGR